MNTLPATPDQWLSALDGAGLPILPTSRQRLDHIASRPGLSAGRLTDIAWTDPSLCLQLLASANQHALNSRSQSLADGVERLSHGIALIGVERAVGIIRELPCVDRMPEQVRRRGYMATLAKAHAAGELAEQWLGRGDGARPAAHTRFLGELLVWALAPDPVAAMTPMLSGGAVDRDKAGRGSLGMSLDELNQCAVDHWLLPGRADLNSRTPAQQRSQQLVQLAARLIGAADANWHSDETADRCQAAARVLNTDPHLLASRTRSAVIKAARSFPESHYVHSARTLLLDGGEPLPPVWVTPPPTAHEPALAKSDSSKPGALQVCSDLLQGFAKSQLGMKEVLGGVTRSLGEGIGLDSVVMSMVTRDQSRLVGRFCSGDDRRLARQFDIDLRKPSLFNRLLKRQQGLLVDRANQAKVWSQLPAECSNLMPEHGFCLMSLFVRDKPVGMFYAVGFPDETARAKARYDQFRKICVATSRALEAGAA